MNFGEKIYRLRKEKGLSQEALAELVGTTRQAISKWENNQGYPETEKLLLLSNVFEVSVDFLLKEEKTDSGADKKGYYVSREMAMGYIANEKKTCQYCGAGFALLALAGVPYVVFQTATAWKLLGMSICILSGIIAIVVSMFIPKDEYKVLRREPLLFDHGFLTGLTREYLSRKKKICNCGGCQHLPLHRRSAGACVYCPRDLPMDRLSPSRIHRLGGGDFRYGIFRGNHGGLRNSGA